MCKTKNRRRNSRRIILKWYILCMCVCARIVLNYNIGYTKMRGRKLSFHTYWFLYIKIVVSKNVYLWDAISIGELKFKISPDTNAFKSLYSSRVIGRVSKDNGVLLKFTNKHSKSKRSSISDYYIYISIIFPIPNNSV